jgi:subtilisin family serine protease
MKRSLLLCLAVIAAALVCLTPQIQVSSAKSDKFKRSARPVPDRYIVVLEDQSAGPSPDFVDAKINELASEYRGSVHKRFAHAIEGYSVEMTEAEAQRLSEDSRIKYVEEDGLVEPQEVQFNATWGISRIDQHSWQYPLSTEYEHNATGAGVNVYVVDTGILTTHPDFGGRAFNGTNTSGDNTGIEDCNGHGTHVAGTIGSNTYGVAKGVRLYSVRVFPCWGGTAVSNVVSGLDWVVRQATLPSVVNMSLGGAASSSLDQAVQATLNKGITVVAAAGNSNQSACNESPARVAGVITVGMTDQRDYRDWVSNYGPCVDLFAPGIIIESLWNDGSYGYSMSGTSAAAPHAAGVAALYLSANPGSAPGDVSDALIQNSTKDILVDIGAGSPNRLLFSNFISGSGGGDGSACAGSMFDGSLISAGNIAFQSSKVGFAAQPGMLKGTLAVPANASFRLHLEKKSSGGRDKGSTFSTVVSSSGGSSQEAVEYKIRSGTYRWRIESLAGGGNYSLCSIVP